MRMQELQKFKTLTRLSKAVFYPDPQDCELPMDLDSEEFDEQMQLESSSEEFDKQPLRVFSKLKKSSSEKSFQIWIGLQGTRLE